PDDRSIAVQRGSAAIADLWLVDADRGITNRLTTSSGNSFPIWSPDSHTILFTKAGARSLVRKEASGVSDEETVIRRAGPLFAADWSGDGRWVLAAEYGQGTKLDLILLAVTPDGKLRSTEPIPYLQTPFNEDYGRFSPGRNPRWVAFQSDESGHKEVYI